MCPFKNQGLHEREGEERGDQGKLCQNPIPSAEKAGGLDLQTLRLSHLRRFLTDVWRTDSTKKKLSTVRQGGQLAWEPVAGELSVSYRSPALTLLIEREPCPAQMGAGTHNPFLSLEATGVLPCDPQKL